MPESKGITKRELKATIVRAQTGPQVVQLLGYRYVISASRVYPRPARPGPAWYWLYTVDQEVDGRRVRALDNTRADSLADAFIRYTRDRPPGGHPDRLVRQSPTPTGTGRMIRQERPTPCGLCGRAVATRFNRQRRLVNAQPFGADKERVAHKCPHGQWCPTGGEPGRLDRRALMRTHWTPCAECRAAQKSQA